jgi:hypothetical protein
MVADLAEKLDRLAALGRDLGVSTLVLREGVAVLAARLPLQP